MANIQVRIPEELEDELERLGKELHGTRSDAVRHALLEGLQAHREKQAVQDYVLGRCSLGRAAHDAGLSIQQVAVQAAVLGVPHFRYSPKEADRDLETLRGRRG